MSIVGQPGGRSPRGDPLVRSRAGGAADFEIGGRVNSAAGVLFFLLFSVVQIAMYIIVRRQLIPPFLIGLIGVITGIIAMTLMGLAQGNEIYQAIFAGIVVGGLISGGTLTMALYFLRGERRLRAGETNQDARYMPPNDEPPAA
jgi:Na+/H+-translocating membrane pyrophosphatase